MVEPLPDVGLSPRAAALLARYPGPVRLMPSPLKWLGVVAAGLVFVAVGLWLIRLGATNPRVPAWVGWTSVLFFGLVAMVGLVQLIPGASSLTLDATGFEVVKFFRRSRRRWSEVGDFAVWRHAGNDLVVFEAARPAPAALASANRALTGRGAGLPDTYGLPAEDLATLLVAWQWRALAAATGP